MRNWRLVATAPGLSAGKKGGGDGRYQKLKNSAGRKSVLETKGRANTYLSGADFDAQLAKEIEATAPVLKDIGLVN